jgi:hypothetical protein
VLGTQRLHSVYRTQKFVISVVLVCVDTGKGVVRSTLRRDRGLDQIEDYTAITVSSLTAPEHAVVISWPSTSARSWKYRVGKIFFIYLYVAQHNPRRHKLEVSFFTGYCKFESVHV